MNIIKEFDQIQSLLDECKEKTMKGVGMTKKRPIVEARRMIRTIKERLDTIGKFAHQKVNE
jgi:hypothetical protein